MSQIEVSLREEDPDIRSRLINLKVRGKDIVTPRRSLCLRGADSEARILRESQHLHAINELPRVIDRKKLEDIDNDADKQEEFYREIRYRFSGMDTAGEITVFVYSYNNKGEDTRNKQPTSAEIEYLCGVLNHPFNDIWVPPIVPQLAGRAYIPYLKQFFETVKSYQKTPFAGLIPHIARIELRLLADLYAEEGINYLAIDFAGKHPLDLVGNINEAVRIASHIEKEYRTTCFLHALNVPITRAHWKNLIVPAKDILLFAMGFNCFGSSHIIRRFPPEVLQKMKSRIGRPFRLFNRGDYGYYRNDADGLREMLAEKQATVISLDSFKRNLTVEQISHLETLFNVERHGLEAAEIRRRLIEKDSLSKYIQGKSKMPQKYLNRVMKVGKD